MQHKEAELVRVVSKTLTLKLKCKKRNKSWHLVPQTSPILIPPQATPWKTACPFRSISAWVAPCRHTLKSFIQLSGLRMSSTQSMPTSITRLNQSSFRSLKIASGMAFRWSSSTSSRPSVISIDLTPSSCRLNIRPLYRLSKVFALKNLWKFMEVCLIKSKYALSWPLQGPTQDPSRKILKTTHKASFVDCLTSQWHLNLTGIQQLSNLKMLVQRLPVLKKRRRKGALLQWAKKSGTSSTIFRIISYKYMPSGERKETCIGASSSSLSEQIHWTQCS